MIKIFLNLNIIKKKKKIDLKIVFCTNSKVEKFSQHTADVIYFSTLSLVVDSRNLVNVLVLLLINLFV